MFYNAQENIHGLPHDPFKALVSPRPIGWIGSQNKDGALNLAPYSFFNAIAENPKLIMFSSMGRKDSLRNCEDTGVFSVNMVGFSQIQAMSDSSAALGHGDDEFTHAGLVSKQCRLIDAPYVDGAFAVLECKVSDIIVPKTLTGQHDTATMVIGQVVGIYIDDHVVIDGKVDVTKVQPAARLGYRDYSIVEKTFEIMRPSS